MEESHLIRIKLREEQIVKRKAVFLDRDGVLNEYNEFITGLDQFRILPGIGPAVCRLNEAGFFVSVATNQPLVARGRLSIADLDEMHIRLVKVLADSAANFDFIAYCPHDPGPMKPGYVSQFVQPCTCRKPDTGMIQQAVEHFRQHGFELDLKNSWMVGDSWRDLLLAQNAGLKAVAIVGAPDRKHPDIQNPPLFEAQSLTEAVDFILKNS